MRFSVALTLLLAVRAANREKHEDDQDIHPPDTEERAVMGPIPTDSMYNSRREAGGLLQFFGETLVHASGGA
jgi:hypothetical protein